MTHSRGWWSFHQRKDLQPIDKQKKNWMSKRMDKASVRLLMSFAECLWPNTGQTQALSDGGSQGKVGGLGTRGLLWPREPLCKWVLQVRIIITVLAMSSIYFPQCAPPPSIKFCFGVQSLFCLFSSPPLPCPTTPTISYVRFLIRALFVFKNKNSLCFFANSMTIF